MSPMLTVGICQMKTTDNKQHNLDTAQQMIDKAVKKGSNLVVLPEMFNTPYNSALFASYAEEYPGITTDFMAQTARKNKIYLVGGSIPEKSQGKLFNTCFIFNPDGSLQGYHRKVHLFDINIPGRITFKESAALTPGGQVSLYSWHDIPLAVMICYDIRFPELAQALALKGAKLIIVPAAFNSTTGPAHWELLMRSRALDNQVYIIAASPARNREASYQAWGHSMIVDPWGTVLAEAGEDEQIIVHSINLERIEQVRRQLPVSRQRRPDLYKLEYFF